MARKPKLQPLDANLLRPAAVDLFGEVPISQRELMLWMWKVPYWMTRWAPLRRVHGYIKSWDVAGKIRAAKLSGRLPDILGDEACPHCGVLLEMDYPRRLVELDQAHAEALRRGAQAAIERGQRQLMGERESEIRRILPLDMVLFGKAHDLGGIKGHQAGVPTQIGQPLQGGRQPGLAELFSRGAAPLQQEVSQLDMKEAWHHYQGVAFRDQIEHRRGV